MKKLIFSLIVLGCLTGCRKESISKEPKGEFNIEFLFEKDGCKVYRFYDGVWVYYSDCRGQVAYKKVTQSGKTTVITKEQTLNQGK